MAKIPTPGRRVTPSGRVGVARMPAQPQPSRRVGVETQRLGQTLRGIGGAFGSLADNLQEMQYDNDVLTAKNSLAADYKTFTDDISKDDDYAGREDKFYTWFDTTTKEYTTTTKSQRAKQDLTNFFAGQRTRMGIQVSAQAQSLLVQDTRLKSETWLTATEQAWANATTDEDREFIEAAVKTHLRKLDADDIYVDGWIEQREIDFLTSAKKLAYDKLKKDAYNTGFDMLLTTGLEPAISFVLDRKNFIGLEPGDRHAVIKRLQIDEKLGEFEDSEREKAEDNAAVNEMSELLSKDDSKPLVDFVDATEDGLTKETWKSVIEGLSNLSGEEKTNYKKYIGLESELFDVLLDKSLIKDYQIKLAKARSTGALSQEDYSTLLGRMKLDLNLDEIGYLRKGFETIEKRDKVSWPLPKWIAPWGTVEGWRTSAKEAEAIARARGSLISWYLSRRDRKKETGLSDILKESLHLDIAGRKDSAANEEWDQALMWMHWGDSALSSEVAARVSQYRKTGRTPESLVKALRSFPDPAKVTVSQLDEALKTEAKIRVRHPDGRTGLIPAGQREAAVKEGYEILE